MQSARPSPRALSRGLAASLLALPLLSTGAPAAAQSAPARFGLVREMLPPDLEPDVAAVLADLDGDGDLDLFVAGEERLYLNDGSGVLLRASGRLPAQSVDSRAAAAGDVDGDLDADLVIGVSGGADRLYLNDGAGFFTDASRQLAAGTGTTRGVALGDLDGDDDLDLVLAIGNGPDRLLVNDGAGVFSNAAFPALARSSSAVALGDVDEDQDLDVVVAVGLDCGTSESLAELLYLNGGPAGFTAGDLVAAPVQDRSRDLALGDVNGDGHLDVFVANSATCFDPSWQNRLYLGDGAGGFTDATGLLAAIEDDTRACALVDVDGDLDLDLWTGTFDDDPDFFSSELGGTNRLFLNEGGLLGESAGALHPLLDATEDGVFGDADGDGDPDLVVVAKGANRLHLNDGSGSFTLAAGTLPAFDDGARGAALHDVNEDGRLDAMLPQRLDLNEGTGRFADASAGLPAMYEDPSDFAFGDVNGDGHVDVFLAVPHEGEMDPKEQDNLLFLGDGLGGFVDATDQLPVHMYEDRGLTWFAALVDVDGDEDLDVIGSDEVDYDGGSDGLWIDLNDGTGSFTPTGTPPPPLSGERARFRAGDVDGDGDVDLVAHGEPGSYHLLLNDGAGAFTDASNQLPASVVVSMLFFLELGDVDADGDLDVLAGHVDFGGVRRNELFLGDGKGSFTDASVQIAQVFDTYRLGDVDGDGDPDLFGDAGLLLNRGGGVFRPAPVVLPDASPVRAMALGDVDLDGDLDALVGRDGQAVVWTNLARQLAWRGLPRIGKPLTLDLYGPSSGSWLLLFSPGTADVPTPLGRLLLDPVGLFVVAGGNLDAAGDGAFALTVPGDPTLVGASAHWQALVGPPFRFTNLERTTFLDL